MRKHSISILIAILLLPTLLSAQSRQATVPPPPGRPALKRDRTQKVLYPKIIQFEDERTVTQELLESASAFYHGGARRRALLALGRIGYPSGINPLLDALVNDRNPEVRALAAFALGEIESHYAAKDLIDRLQISNESSALVRARAAEALGKIASNKLSAGALGPYGVRGIADELIRQLPSTTGALSDDAKLIGPKVLVSLLRIKEPSSIGPITGQLGSPDPEMRWQAANALARIRDGIAAAVPALLPLLQDKDWMVRANAARALGVAKDNRAVLPLAGLLSDPEKRVAANAINALGAIGDARAVEPLINAGNRDVSGYKAFNREKEGVPAQQNSLLLIASALGNIKDVRAVPFLKTLRFIDGHIGWAPEVEVALAKFGEGAFFDVPEGVALPKENWKAASAYAQGLGQLGTERARQLLLDMREGKTHGKLDARALPDILSALAAAKAPTLREILIESLKAEDVIVRSTAATLLVDLGDTSEPVLSALRQAYAAAKPDKMNDARIAILEASEKLKQPLTVQALQENTKDSDYVVRLRAAELLRQSSTEVGTLKLQVGKAETNHDRAYWRRMAAMTAYQKNPVAVLHTKKGAIRIELFATDAPMTVDNFMQLAKSGFYNGLTFMRVVPNFVIQGGDPRNDTNGGPGYQIRDEINMRPYLTGTVGMALSGKDTGGSQFFITHSPQPHLDGGYTVFGQVIEGMETVNQIARDDRIEHVEIIEGQ